MNLSDLLLLLLEDCLGLVLKLREKEHRVACVDSKEHVLAGTNGQVDDLALSARI